jgi:hypothetical protein
MSGPPPDFPSLPEPTLDRNFLDHYFASIYNKLEADALLFNRTLPHAGLVGSEMSRQLRAFSAISYPFGLGLRSTRLSLTKTATRASRPTLSSMMISVSPSSSAKSFP